MTVLLYTYTDWQSSIVSGVEEALKKRGERLFWIGRRSSGVDSTTIRGVPPGNPFKNEKTFEADGSLPLLEDPISFEQAYLPAYAYQMSRYIKGYGSRGHDFQCFHEYRDHFHLTARKFKRLIQREEIISVFFINMPHTGDDYLLYRVAESLGIKVTMLMVAPFEGRFFSLPSIESYGRLNRDFPGQSDEVPSLDALKQQLEARVDGYMSGARRQEENTALEMAYGLQVLLRRSPLSFLNPQSLFSELNEFIRLRRGLKKNGRALRELRSGKKARSFLRWVSSLEKDSESLPERFVYVPLHYQPELTTAPQGGVFGDQALAIETLLDQLPSDVHVVAKENPKQGSFNRERTFTDRLRQLDRLTVVHPSMSSGILEERCLAVATVTGTAGWEAIRDSRPCICFGHAWYLDCPGVHQFDTAFDLDVVLSNPPTTEETEVFVNEVVTRSHKGIVYEAFLKEKGAEFEKKNFAVLVDTFTKLILGELETTFR